MYDFLRVAGLATLTLGAAGASGAIPSTGPAVAALSVSFSKAQPAFQSDLQFPAEVRDLAVQEAILPPADLTLVETDDAPAASLAVLVRRHASTETANAEQRCLAIAVYYESKGEPLEGQLAVARVVMNRAESGRFASTLCGVVRQPGQFSFVRGGLIPSARDSHNWRTAVGIAKIAQGDLWDAKHENALFFHAKRVAPGWRMARMGAIGNHVFYR